MKKSRKYFQNSGSTLKVLQIKSHKLVAFNKQTNKQNKP